MKKRYDRPLTLEEIAALPDEKIDYSDVPELGDEFWSNARLCSPDRMTEVRLNLPAEVAFAFDRLAGGRKEGEALMRDLLVEHIQRQSVSKTRA